MMDLAGKTLGQYQVIRELGRGGMAVVYEAYQPALNRTVALKVLPPNLSADAAFVQRFMREARAAARLEHPNIVAIYDVLDLKGIYCIVMQKLEGEPLHVLIRRNGRLPLDRATRLLGQIASALDYAHESGIVHRDVKPSNIMVGRGDHAWLTDFGIAQIVTNAQPAQTRSIIGTPEYISPEQASGKPAGPASDIYSLGVVAYHLLTGRTPFEAATVHALLYQHAYAPPPPARSFAPDLPPEVDKILARALAKDPAQRFIHAQQLVQSLSAVSQTKASPRDHAQKPPRRSLHLATGVAGLLIVGLLLFAWTMTNVAKAPRSTPLPATQGRDIAISRSPVVVASPTLMAGPTRVAVEPTPLPTPTRLWADLRVYRPSLDEAQSLPSMWKLAVYRDLFTPGTNTYKVIVRPADVYRWGFSWHARDQARLREILQPLSVELLINDVRVPDSFIQVYEDVTQDGWVGRRWVTAIADWPVGKTVVIEARYELSREVYDGQNTLAPGVYHQIIYVSVQ